MKTKKARIIFLATALTYNLILGFYLRDFLVLSHPTGILSAINFTVLIFNR